MYMYCITDDAYSSHIEQDHGTTYMFGRGTTLLTVPSELVEMPALVMQASWKEKI